MANPEQQDEMAGGCLCGAVRYAISTPLRTVAHCHCTMCRRASGAAVATWAAVAKEGLSVTKGEAAVYVSSASAVRKFCANCGAQLFFDYVKPGRWSFVSVGTLDRPERATPALHIWTSNRIPWLHLDDGLPEHAEEPGA